MRDSDNHTVVTLVSVVLGLLLLVLAAAGCSPAPQAEGQLRLAAPMDQRWEFLPMTGGPGIFTACHRGNRLYVIDSYANREHEFHGTSPKGLAVVGGSC